MYPSYTEMGAASYAVSESDYSCQFQNCWNLAYKISMKNKDHRP